MASSTAGHCRCRIFQSIWYVMRHLRMKRKSCYAGLLKRHWVWRESDVMMTSSGWAEIPFRLLLLPASVRVSALPQVMSLQAGHQGLLQGLVTIQTGRFIQIFPHGQTGQDLPTVRWAYFLSAGSQRKAQNTIFRSVCH